VYIFKEVLRFIEEDTELDREKKTDLINLIQTSSIHPGYSIQWVKACKLFFSPEFSQKNLNEKVETVRLFARGLKKNQHRTAFLEVVRIFLRISCRSRKGIDLQPFTQSVLEKIKSEPDPQLQGQLVEVLLNCPHDSPQLQDYLPGLHHPEETVSFRIIEFINQRFGITGMIALLKEISRLERPPSLFFWVNLRPLLNQYPEIFNYPEMLSINPMTLWPLFKIKAQRSGTEISRDLPVSAKWFKLRLYFISGENQEKKGEEFQNQLASIERPHLFSGRRWHLLKQDIERIKNDVPPDHHKDGDSRPGGFN
jgi:hypothetical protein